MNVAGQGPRESLVAGLGRGDGEPPFPAPWRRLRPRPRNAPAPRNAPRLTYAACDGLRSRTALSPSGPESGLFLLHGHVRASPAHTPGPRRRAAPTPRRAPGRDRPRQALPRPLCAIEPISAGPVPPGGSHRAAGGAVDVEPPPGRDRSSRPGVDHPWLETCAAPVRARVVPGGGRATLAWFSPGGYGRACDPPTASSRFSMAPPRPTLGRWPLGIYPSFDGRGRTTSRSRGRRGYHGPPRRRGPCAPLPTHEPSARSTPGGPSWNAAVERLLRRPRRQSPAAPPRAGFPEIEGATGASGDVSSAIPSLGRRSAAGVGLAPPAPRRAMYARPCSPRDFGPCSDVTGSTTSRRRGINRLAPIG